MTAVLLDILQGNPTLTTAAVLVGVLLAWRLKAVRYGRFNIEFGADCSKASAAERSVDR